MDFSDSYSTFFDVSKAALQRGHPSNLPEKPAHGESVSSGCSQRDARQVIDLPRGPNSFRFDYFAGAI